MNFFKSKPTPMKKIILSTLIAVCCLALVNAQSTKELRDISTFEPAPMLVKGEATLLFDQGTTTNTTPTPAPAAMPRTTVGILGTTVMDVQTYGSVPTRLINYGDGTLSGIWMIGYDSDNLAWADRGTGYNHFSNGAWGPAPSERLEGDTRTGFPAFAGTGTNGEVVLTHKTPQPYEHWTYTKNTDETDWTQGVVPNDIPGGILWPRVAGDINTDYVHVIGITTPEAFGGMEYNGMLQHLLYSRSSDGGATWEAVNVVIPDADSSFYNPIPADAYAIDSRDNYVAVALFTGWGDLAVFKSEDYGDTWTKFIVNDFPLDKYVAGTGYTADDLYNSDFNGPDSLAIMTTDESGAVIIDNNGQVHVSFGEMYVIDAGGFAYYPDWSGLRYWNESFGQDSSQLIADLIDVDGSGYIEIEAGQFGGYQNSLTSFPSMGIDADNNIYLAYAGVTEEHINITQLQHYRHIYMMKTEFTSGEFVWSEPHDMINDEFYEEPEFIAFIEAVYPSVARLVDDQVHFIFQEDLTPGLVAWIDEDPAQTSNITYFSANKDDFSNAVTSNKEIAGSELSGMQIAPNPAKGQFELSYELNTNGPVEIRLINSLGQTVKTMSYNDQAVGSYQLSINTNLLSTGLYFVQLRQADQVGSLKVVLE